MERTNFAQVVGFLLTVLGVVMFKNKQGAIAGKITFVDGIFAFSVIIGRGLLAAGTIKEMLQIRSFIS